MNSHRPILLVEDHPDDIELTHMALEQSGVKVPIQVARSGLEALSYLYATLEHEGSRTIQQPQLILLDLNMPKINGLEVLRHIKSHEHLRHIPVIILTSSKEDSDITSAYALGANAYIRKPVEFQSFVNAIRCIESFWLSLNHISMPRATDNILTCDFAKAS